jgi:protein-disulfide isomerase
VANRRKKGARGGPGKMFYVLLAGVAVAGVLALLLLKRGGADQTAGHPLSVAQTAVPADSNAGIVEGRADAPVTFEEFADYTCPHCAEFTSLTGRALRQNYVETGKVRWILYDFPLSRETNAIAAALAARCAGAQGDYWAMHDLLYAHQLEWALSQSPEGHFADYAGQAGVDVGKWKQCYSDQTYISQIIASRNYGNQLGVNSTPTLFIDGQRVSTKDYDYGSLEKLIQQAASKGAGSP